MPIIDRLPSGEGGYHLAQAVFCPICKREFDINKSEAPPFCSDRCRTIDLGRWLDERYGLPDVPDPEADEQPEELPE